MKSYNFDGKTIRIDELEYLESMTCNSEFPLYQTDALCLFPNLTEQPTEAFKHISNNNVNYPCIDFFDYLLSEGSYHLLFFNVESKDNCPVLLRLGTLCYMKMWINDRIVYNGAVHGNDSVYILYPLQNGTNRFQVAITLYSDAYIKNALPSFSLLISHANNPADGADSLLFKDYIQEYVCSRIHVLYGINPSDTLQFSILPFDYIRLDENTEINLQIFDDENRLLLERPVDMTRTYSIGLQGLGRAGNSLYYLYFRYLVDNEWFTDKFVVRTGPLNLHKKLEWEFLAHRKITADDDNLLVDNIVGRLQTLNDLFIETRQEKQVEHVDESEYCRLLSETKYLIDMMKSGKKLKDHIVTSRFFSCYFRSQLDRSYELFNVSLPENYNPDTKYPLILCLDYKRYSWVSKIVSRKKNTTFIFADVSCRGYSMGSYVGEAAFWENLNLLTSLLNIDLDRLYLIGISAGAFSALSLACSYPDMFAAITVSCGVAQEKSLRNIEQLPILSIGAVQEMYHNAGFKSLDRHMLGKNPDYHRIVLEDADDNTIFFIKYSQYIYDWLLKHTYRCPDKIALYTEKLLHGKSHWLQISEMDQNSHSACVEAETFSRWQFFYSLQRDSRFKTYK